MKFLVAVGCFLLACLIGQGFVSWGINNRGGAWPISPLVIYLAIVVYASPFWFFTFLFPFILISSKSIFWKWYTAPFFGALIGFISSGIVFGNMNGNISDNDDVRLYFAPSVIGCSLFLLGTIFKSLSDKNSAS